jgi:CubicO group peptidase (beta-lactamase class C family)
MIQLAMAFLAADFYFPPPGESVQVQKKISFAAAGIDARIVDALVKEGGDRWALWRNGRLLHVHGDFNFKQNVASHRKTWHAMTVGAALLQKRIPSLDQHISVWNPELKGNDAEATWRHVITQSAGFDYPYGEFPDFKPGQMWTYSDLNLIQLNRALARVWGLPDYHKGYEKVLKEAFFDAIGMRGWEIGIRPVDDGIRLILDLEDMGRLGLLVLARGQWNGRQLVPRAFVEALERKQTRGMKVNYQGPNDGMIGMDPKAFPEAPYGFLTWSNEDQDYSPGAGKEWAWATGKGGNMTFWNHKNGIVFAGMGIKKEAGKRGIPHIIEEHLRK